MFISIAQIQLWLCGKENATISYARDNKCSWLIENNNLPDDYGYILSNGSVNQWNPASESFVTCNKIQHRVEAFNSQVQELQNVKHKQTHIQLREDVVSGVIYTS